jgi:hypothetical protein
MLSTIILGASFTLVFIPFLSYLVRSFIPSLFSSSSLASSRALSSFHIIANAHSPYPYPSTFPLQVDCYAMYAASALAANTIVRSAVGAALPLVISQWVAYQGLQWVATIVGCVGIALSPSPFLFYRYGHKIRHRSKYAPGLDLKIRDEVLENERKEKEGGKEKA